MLEDTISAVTTALGEGAVGIIRVSGAQALAIAEQLFQAASGKPLGAYPVNTLVYGHIHDVVGNVVDEVLCVYMQGPRSYTAEDVVEIQCHGGVLPLKKILDLTYAAGARPAEAGEFTKRAFLNGRLDLTQAEAVMDIIRSRSEASLKLALRQQQGQLAAAVRETRKLLFDIIVNIEAVVDYPEEDIEDVTYAMVQEKAGETLQKIRALLANASTGKILREGLRTAIVGRPNVGKSSLLNSLLKEERAIVSQYAGTTRDVIEEQMLINGVPLVLADTAGIRATEDFVEKIGVEKSRRLLQEAELVICVLDGSEALTAEDKEILAEASTKPCVIVINKSDLEVKITPEELAAYRYQAQEGDAHASLYQNNVITISTKTKQGMEEFSTWLANYVYGNDGTLGDGIYVQNARHELLLKQAAQSLEDALGAADACLPYDCILIDVRHAIDLLGEITGETMHDEIINEIFSRFCIGK